jgi:hypothetical protein
MYLLSKVVLYLFGGYFGVLQNVVEECGGHRVIVHSEVHQNPSDGEGVDDVRIAGTSELPSMGPLGHKVGVTDFSQVGAGPLLSYLLKKLMQVLRIFPFVANFVQRGSAPKEGLLGDTAIYGTLSVGV